MKFTLLPRLMSISPGQAWVWVISLTDPATAAFILSSLADLVIHWGLPF